MPVLPIPDYKPDITDYEGNSTQTLLNVVPRLDGYGPFQSFSTYSSALPAACRGFYYARNADGTITAFAGTATRLWRLNNTDFTWIPVSKVSALTSISNATPAVFTLTSHGLSIGDAIVLSTSSALPTGLTVGTVYYVISAGFTANAFEVSTTAGGSAVNTTGAGSGTHSFTAQYTAVPSGDQWQFAPFNNFIFATQINGPLQVYDLTTSTAFADCAGSPPQARYISVVGRFLVLSGLGSSTPYRIQWSGLNATTTWTSGVNSSDFQDLPDGGIVRGVAGGEYGLICQDAAIRRMIYVAGVLIFQIERISDEKGLFAPLSLIRAGERVFYIGSDGFKMYLPGSSPVAIGKERIDRTFFADVDSSSLQLCIGASDPKTSRVYWAYKSVSGTTGLYDKIIVYDWVLDKFTILSLSGEYLSSLARPSITLEGLDAISSSIDALPFSLDDVSTQAFAQLAGFNNLHKLGFYTGSNLEATAVTASKGGDGNRIRVRGFRPVSDSATVYGSLSTRDTASATEAVTAETAMNAVGICPQNVNTRYARGKIRIPAGTSWTYLNGIEPDVVSEGKR